ncbi:unnamed protein product [Lepidochelys kempii]
MGRWRFLLQPWRAAGSRAPRPPARGLASSFPLPRQPVPPLAQTLERYLRSLEVLVTPEELEETGSWCRSSGRLAGRGRGCRPSWSAEPPAWRTGSRIGGCRARIWRAAYPSPSTPARPSCSPNRTTATGGGSSGLQRSSSQGCWISRLRLISRLCWWSTGGGTPSAWPSTAASSPPAACPAPSMTGSCCPPRGAGPPLSSPSSATSSFFQLEVYNSDGTPLTVDQLHLQLQRVRGLSWKTDKEPLGVLTGDHRHTWGQAYSTLMRDRLNRESARCIQRSLFTVCLDAPVLKVSDERYPSRVAAQMLHGGGSYSNSGNRWFDKTLQFIVGEDGVCGVLYEQAVADGAPIATIIDHVLDYCKDPDTARAPMTPLPLPPKLYFYITPEIQWDIERAKQNLDILITDLDISCFTYRGFGQGLPKRWGLRPDSLFQVALQLAYYRTHGSLCATSEVVSLRRFHQGRTDAVRPAAPPGAAPGTGHGRAPRPGRGDAVPAAGGRGISEARRTEQVLAGQGIDRHLLGLKLAAIGGRAQRLPGIFMDTAYAIATHCRLLTGQVSSRSDCLMVYGPQVPDGYGVCYNPLDAHVNFAITAFNCCHETHARRLARALHRVLDQLARLLGESPGGRGCGGAALMAPRHVLLCSPLTHPPLPPLPNIPFCARSLLTQNPLCVLCHPTHNPLLCPLAPYPQSPAVPAPLLTHNPLLCPLPSLPRVPSGRGQHPPSPRQGGDKSNLFSDDGK